jgi:hypothetical protein
MALPQSESDPREGVGTVVQEVCVHCLHTTVLCHAQVDFHELIRYYLLGRGGGGGGGGGEGGEGKGRGEGSRRGKGRGEEGEGEEGRRRKGEGEEEEGGERRVEEEGGEKTEGGREERGDTDKMLQQPFPRTAQQHTCSIYGSSSYLVVLGSQVISMASDLVVVWSCNKDASTGSSPWTTPSAGFSTGSLFSSDISSFGLGGSSCSVT